MRLNLSRATPSSTFSRRVRQPAGLSVRACNAVSCAIIFYVVMVCGSPSTVAQTAGSSASPTVRVRRFLAGRDAGAAALDRARQQHAAMLAHPRTASLGAVWQPVGPLQIASLAYGAVTGRITSIAIDPADATGNTVYIGTAGGGVWKSTNANGTPASVQFVPLTDTLPVFSLDAGSSSIPSLSIGALSVANGVILAGTGDPNDALDSYYGAGVLRSADGGATWTLAQESHDGVNGNHSFVGLGFAGFAWSSVSPSTVVAAISDAAEGALVNAADTTYSARGLYYSTDAGVTWQMATLKDGTQTVQTPLPGGENGGGNAATAVVWNPVRQRFYAAVRYHGYYESADGANWTRLASQPGMGLTASACPPNAGTTGSAGCPIFRGALAVQPASGDTFAFTVDAQNLDQGIWRDVCTLTNAACSTSEAVFGVPLNTAPIEEGGGSTAIFQGGYNLSLAAVASGTDTLVFAGTVDLYRCSLAVGCGFRNTTNTQNGCAAPAMVAPAQHAIATLATAAAPLVYLGNDGGLWSSTDGVDQQGTPCSSDDASHFQNLNGGLGSLAEVVNFSQHPSNANTLLVGVGANGTAATSAASSNPAWPQLAGGEGGYTAIDPGNPANWYISTAAGVNITYCGQGASCGPADFTGLPTIGPGQVAQDASLVDAPWLLDPALTSSAIVGTCRIWRGPAGDGSDWGAANDLSAEFGTPDASCSSASSFVRSIAAGGPVSGLPSVANSGSEVLYAGLAGTLDGGRDFGGHLFSTGAANTASSATVWSDLALSPVTNDLSDANVFNPGGFDISSVAVDAHDPTGSTVYATVMGFAGNGINAPHLYRSLDAGAHWTNISSNLPNAPANSVVVDPNDANTLYVALDTGVYATRQVATCASANCWDVYGVSLPNAPVVQLAAAPAMPTSGGATGALRAATYGRGIWQIPLLTATPPLLPQMALSPASLSFAAEAVGTASAAQTITVTNTGNAPLQVTSLTTTGDFEETDDCAGTQVAPGAACSVQVVFLATAVGSRAGVLTVYGNVSGGQATAALTGTGLAPAAVVLDPLSLNFGSVTVGATAMPQNITISNTGGVTATLQTPTATGDFQITANTCGATLAAETGCTVAIAFTPTASGTRSGSFSIADSAGTQTASLSGAGAAPATDGLTPLTLAFGPQQVGSTSPSQTVTLTNTGDNALTLIAVQVSGEFSATSGCGASLSGHASCAIVVAYVPKTVGSASGVLTVSDQFRSQTVPLSGTGTAPPGISLTPAQGLTFAATGVTETSAAQTITLSNQGGAALLIGGVSVTGDFSIPASSNTCGASLSPQASCTLQVVFAPTVGGVRMGSVSIADNAAGSPQSLALQGTGVDFALSAAGAASVTVTSGGTAVFPLLLSSAAGVPGVAALTCAGAPTNATCVVEPSSAPLGSTASIAVTVATGVNASAALRPTRVLWWALVLPIALVRPRSRRTPRMGLLLLAVCGLLCATGCGSGRLIPASSASTVTGPTPVTTPAGSYPITVSAGSAGLTRTVSLTLVVQ